MPTSRSCRPFRPSLNSFALECRLVLSDMTGGVVVQSPPPAVSPEPLPPGTIQKPTVIIITDRTTSDDLANWKGDYYSWWSGAAIETGISGPSALMNTLAQYKDDSISYLVLSGHGLLFEAGVSGTKGPICNANLTDAQIEQMKQKLAPGATVEIASCQSGLNEASMQALADRLGCIVTAPTGMCSQANSNDGTWVIKYPTPPAPPK